MLNSSDQAKLVAAVRLVLAFMGEERVQQLRVMHRDLHKLANLGNARVNSRSLRDDVDQALADPVLLDLHGPYMVVDVGLVDGEYVMCFVKQQKLVNTLTYDAVLGQVGRRQ